MMNRNKTRGHGDAHETGGRVIHWARLYDPLIKVLTLGKEGAVREMTLDLAEVSPGENVLDVGCGTGNLTMAAKNRVGPAGKVCGIDPAPEMIEMARNKSARAGMELDLRTGIIEDIPFPSGTFDVVLSSFMVHHLPDEVKKKGFVEIYRVLVSGGRMLVIDLEPSNASTQGRIMSHLIGHGRIRGNITLLPPLLRKAGFERIEVGATRYSPLSYALAKRGNSR